MKRLLYFGLALCMTGFAPAPFAKSVRISDPTAADLARMQGTWRVVSQDLATLSFGVRGRTIEIVGNRLTYRNDGQATCTWTMKLDARTTPKRLELWEGEDRSQRPETGIYTLEDDKLVICETVGEERYTWPENLDPSTGRAICTSRRVR